MAQYALQTLHVSKHFVNNFKAISDVSINIKKSEIVSIIGPSGCGKSTFFNILSGIEEQSEGKILVNGKDMSVRYGKFGYCFQSPLLLPWRTATQNISLGLEVKGYARQRSQELATDMLSEFGLSEFAGSHPEMLSGGMRQRIALLRTILFNSEILLLDEPFGALDALTRLSCQLWLLKVHKKLKPTILFITHDVREAILLSDTIIVLSQRPMHIIKAYTNSLSRPRSVEQLRSKFALQIEQNILSTLLSKNHYE